MAVNPNLPILQKITPQQIQSFDRDQASQRIGLELFFTPEQRQLCSMQLDALDKRLAFLMQMHVSNTGIRKRLQILQKKYKIKQLLRTFLLLKKKNNQNNIHISFLDSYQYYKGWARCLNLNKKILKINNSLVKFNQIRSVNPCYYLDNRKKIGLTTVTKQKKRSLNDIEYLVELYLQQILKYLQQILKMDG